MTPRVDHILLPDNNNIFNLFKSIFDPKPPKIQSIQFHGLHHRHVLRPAIPSGFQNKTPTQAKQMEKTEKVMAMETSTHNRHEPTKHVLYNKIPPHSTSRY